MANIPVKWAHSGMRGAPVISGVAGSLISALRTFLITGFAPTAAVSATALDGIATIMLPSAQSFEEHGVVLLAGATTPGFNGEERVLTTASDRITVATTAANGPIAGSITVRYAPVGGWEEVFSKTNVSVFRSTDVTGSRFFLRVDDTGTTAARVMAYESMTDVDTGLGAFPTPAQSNGGGYWHKSGVANAVAVRWKMFADSRFLALAVAAVSHQSAAHISAPLRGFGDPIALSPSGDVWSCMISVAGSGNTNNSGFLDSCVPSSAGNGIHCARGISGMGGSVVCNPRAYTSNSSEVSGVSTYLGAGPSAVDGEIKLSKLFVSETATNSAPRAEIPGVRFIPQTGVNAILIDGDILPGASELQERRLMAVNTGTNQGVSNPAGVYLVDTTGPWREQ
ncbi:MAG: hypothetical protein RSD57_16245 [Comamonas sp.]